MIEPGKQPHLQVLSLNGDRYLVATPAQASEAGGAGRSWQAGAVVDQEVPSLVELHLPQIAYHEGGGFTFEGIEHTYEVASGWDATVPGKIATWPKFQSGEELVTADYKGWLLEHEGYLFLLRGRYVTKYALDELGGASWLKTATKDFGANLAVAGKPVSVAGKMLVPIVNTATGALQPFQELTTVGSPDVWTAADAALTARSFVVWKEKVVLAHATNQIRLCDTASTLTDAGQWAPATSSDGYRVGDEATVVTQMYVHGPYLVTGTNRGPFYFDEDLNSRQAIPELEGERDDQNGIGGGYAHNALILPSRGGLVRWVPDGPWGNIGPEQEGGLEGDLTEGWGRVSGLASYGRMAFIVANDVANSVAALWSLQPPRASRAPYAIHCHQMHDDSLYEDVAILRAGAQPVAPYSPATWSDDAAVGTIAWASASNAGANDGSHATAAAGTTHYLKGLNPNPNLPDDSALLGVELVVNRSLG